MFNLPKDWYSSKTVWASILGGAAAVLGLVAHIQISSADVQQLATDAALAGSAVASIVAIIGRYKASAPIKGTAAAANLVPVAGAMVAAGPPTTQAKGS